MFIDMHTHSSFSPDALSAIEDMYEKAVQLGLKIYAITDHCDCNFWFPADKYVSEFAELRDREMYGSCEYVLASTTRQKQLKKLYSDKIEILCGVELGQPLQNLSAAEKVISDKELDFIIGSHHQNKGMDDFYWINYKEMNKDEIYTLMDMYFKEMFEMCRWGKFDVLGHLTYPLRYIQGEYNIKMDLKRYDDIITEIFKTLIEKECGIEINTSGLRQKYGKTFPELRYIKMYKELGGEIITVGSDAHCCNDIGKGTDNGIELAKTAGFKYISYFKRRKPEFIKISEI